MDFNALIAHGGSVEEKMNDEESYLNGKLLNAAMSIFTHANNLDNPADQIFHEANGNAHRLQLAQITEM